MPYGGYEAVVSCSHLTARYLQAEPVPEIKDQNRPEDGNDQTAGMKSASCAWWIKQMRYRSADNRADNSKHHCPCDRQMCMHKRFRDTAREEPDNDISDKMKHDFLR